MDAPTAGVLRDITLIVWLALLIGVAAYKWVRQTRPSAVWNLGGKVEVLPYTSLDAIVLAAISILLLGGLQKVVPAAESAAAADTELSATAMFVSILMQLLVCAVLLFYLRAIRNLDPVDLFGIRRLSAGRVFTTVLIFMLPTLVIVMFTSSVVTLWLEGFWPDLAQQESVEAFRKSTDPLAKTLLVIAAAIVAPIVEEVIFRGFIYGVIKRFTDGYFAALCSALLFAVVHFHIGSMIPLAILALVFCAAYERTGSLAVPILMHAVFNGTSIALMLFFPELK
ncbi:type II CAAX endopeptidase family protein [Prosthecobacter sp. SYSU 5D2]|uniref:CPBP family intramembrane glutamic endopeptidase n=1 Tax=Prosthecobacter sp. SYSU 5D2 TaxID=3134134 RepID=UPI0031FE5109